MESIRTFIALDIGKVVRTSARKLIDRLAQGGAIVRWQSAENLHVTLKFLGEVPNIQTPKICQLVADLATRHAPFSLNFRCAGAFPDISRARTVWLGLEEDEGCEALCKLHAELEAIVEPEGFPPESRQFHPHLTLGRVKSSKNLDGLADLLGRHANYEGGQSDIAELVVYASYLDREGPNYQPMTRCRLTG